MARVIGFVKSLQNGAFFAKDAQGAIRELKAGDQVFQNELVYGSPNNPQNAQVIIDVALANAPDITLSGSAQLYTDISVLGGAFEKEEAIVSKDSVESAWKLSTGTPNLEGQVDAPAAGLEETAAGQGLSDTERPGSTLFDARTGGIGDVTTLLNQNTLNGGTNQDPLGNGIDTPNLNDQPVVLDVIGSVNEALDGPNLITENLITGKLVASDADVGDTHTFFAVTDSLLAPEGVELVVNTDGTYSVTGDFNALAVGETATVSFQYYAVDNGIDVGAPHASAPAKVTITVIGTNDVPVITNTEVALAGTVMEAGNNDDGTIVAGFATISGQLSATDVDNGAKQTWSIQGKPSTTYGTIFVDEDGKWTYTLDNSLATTQALKEEQSVTQEYVIRVTDDFGAYVDQTITVTINGTNDSPEITNATTELSGIVKEASTLGDESILPGKPIVSGQLSASDVDNDATQKWSIQGTPSTTYGVIAIDATGKWTYTLDNTLTSTQALKEGQTVTQNYTIRVTDDFGAYKDQTVSITIHGSNDAPTITVNTGNVDNTNDVVYESGLTTGTAPSAGAILATGTFTIADADGLDDIKSISVAGTTFTIGTGSGEYANLAAIASSHPVIHTPTYGDVTITDYSNGVFSYAYTLTDAVKNNLSPATDTLGKDPFTVSVSDGTAPSTNATVTIDIVDDTPTVVASGITPSSFDLVVTNNDFASSAGYNSSFGYYVKGADGVPTTGVIIWDGVHNSNLASIEITGYTPSQIGFFLIPNGDNINAALSNGSAVTFVQVSGEWKAQLNGGTLVAADGHVLFDNTVLNFDAGTNAYTYVLDNSLAGNLNWEDIAGGGDRDNNDVNLNAAWSTTGHLTVDESTLNIDAKVDFSSAFTFNFGADGAGTKVYELSVNSGSTGLVDTATNTAVTLHVNGGVIEGRAGSAIVFTLSVANDGKVTLDQQRAVVHSDVTNPDDATDIASGLITLKASITDSDTDTQSASIDIGSMIRFEDDAPSAQNDTITTNEDTSVIINILVNDTVGADGYPLSPIAISTQPTHGTAEVVNDGGVWKIKYTPNENYNGTDEIKYTLTDKDGDVSKPATVAVNVTAVNDAPVIDLDGSMEYKESFENLAGVKTSGYTIIQQTSFVGDHGMVWTTAGGNAGLEVQNGNVGGSLASDGKVKVELDSHSLVKMSTTVIIPAGEESATLSFDYKPRPGSENDSPMKVTLGDASFVISGTTGAISNILGDIGTPSIVKNANGWMSVTVNVSSLTDGENTLSFEGLGLSNSLGAYLDKIALSVDGGNNYETTFTENGASVAIADSDIVITDVDDTKIESASIVLTKAQAGDFLVYNGATYSTIVGGNISVSITGTATLADYQNMIKSVTYGSTSENPSAIDRVIEVTVNDSNSISNTAITTVHVKPVDDLFTHTVIKDEWVEEIKNIDIAAANFSQGFRFSADVELDVGSNTFFRQADFGSNSFLIEFGTVGFNNGLGNFIQVYIPTNEGIYRYEGNTPIAYDTPTNIVVEYNQTDGAKIIVNGVAIAGTEYPISGSTSGVVTDVTDINYLLGDVPNEQFNGKVSNVSIVTLYDNAQVFNSGDETLTISDSDGGTINLGIFALEAKSLDTVVLDGKVDLKLSLQDVINMTDSDNTLTILGDASDSVNIPIESTNYTVAIAPNVGGFDICTYTSTNASDPTVIVKIDQDIQHS